MINATKLCISLNKNIRTVFLCLLILSPLSVHANEHPLRFGVLSIAQPARIFEKWQPFADYLSEQLGQKVEIVVPRGFGKMKKTIVDEKVDFFYVNSLVFYRLKEQKKAEAVAQMKNIDGKTTSVSQVFVKRGSGINKIEDLKGKNFAYVSPMGAGGYIAPRAYLYESGLKSGVDNKEVFTKNLSNSIHGVLLGDYDAGTMCGVNFKLMSKKIETGELKIIGSSDAYPENVIGARSSLDKKTIQKFKQVLLDMPSHPEGKKLLKKMNSMKIQSFVKYDEASELITKELLREGKL